jgi:hypothetical protein
MTQADSVHSTPRTDLPSINPAAIAGLDWLDIEVDASPTEVFQAIGRLRKEARDEILRLVDFLDTAAAITSPTTLTQATKEQS